MKEGANDYLIKNTLTKNSLCHSIKKAIDHVALEKKVREQQHELEMFASIASHDLKTPLRTIGSFAQIIMEGLEKSNMRELIGHKPASP